MKVKGAFPVISILGIALCLLLSFLLIHEGATAMLLIFNLLFASLIFPLKGTLKRKLCLMFMGNFIGLLWNYLFYLLTYIGVYQFGEVFKALCIILSPFLNMIWIVSFWSISLANLSNAKEKM
ncbi:MAG: hypothetical protein QXH37_03155 [Candidatus Bathyarchaeia archaeon]